MSRRILIVDDEREMRELLRDRLVHRGFEVELAAGYEAAVEWLDAGCCDAVVTDIAMPGQSGIELCAWLRANRPDVPTVVITGFGSLDTAIAAIAVSRLPKPVITTHGTSGRLARSHSQSSIPLWPCIWMSVTTASQRSASSRSKAAS